jgi:glutaredoxin
LKAFLADQRVHSQRIDFEAGDAGREEMASIHAGKRTTPTILVEDGLLLT